VTWTFPAGSDYADHGQAVDAARVVCLSILDALDLLRHPLRLVATLRT
jgi:hypothetical protein